MIADLLATLASRCTKIASAVTARGGEANTAAFGAPAKRVRVEAVERQLGLLLPSALRQFVLTYASSMEFSWQLPRTLIRPEGICRTEWGQCEWSLDLLANTQHNAEGWRREVFPSPDDPYDAVWHGKLAFHEVSNGDFIAIDVHPDRPDAVIYLSHDGSDFHGAVLGHDFQDFLDRWSRVAFAGPEDWEWEPFYNSESKTIDPDGKAAKAFRALLGLPAQ